MNRRIVRIAKLLLCGCVAVPLFAEQAGPPLELDISWFTIDGGGVMFSTGGDFELSGTIGQPDAGELSGGDFTLNGGFWYPVSALDCNGDGAVNRAETAALVDCLLGPGGGIGPGCGCFDTDSDGDVTLLDFAPLARAFEGP
jgi:hypothetical protein